MITPRQTRLVRVPDLHAFRDVIAALALDGTPGEVRDRLVVVPTRGAARQLQRTLEAHLLVDGHPAALALPDFVTRDQLYDRLYARLDHPPRRLTAYEREVIAAASAEAAEADGAEAPFRLRPGLIAELVRFYDELRRHNRGIARFEEILADAFEADLDTDRGAERMARQTRFLAATFREYERRIADTAACDEHALRDALVAHAATWPIRDVVVTVGDWIADPNGLRQADFDLLTRLPRLDRITLVATEGLLASGFHERLHNQLPEVDELQGTTIVEAQPRVRPALETPSGVDGQTWFVCRDREEELVSVARRVRQDLRTESDPIPPDRRAVVFRRPLPYLYVARSVFGAARIPYQTSDALPLAAEPVSAALDLVLDFVESHFARAPLVALLRSPHFAFDVSGSRVPRRSISALDRVLSESRYLGELDRLEALPASWAANPESKYSRGDRALAEPALQAALACARELAPLIAPAPASEQIARLLAFVRASAGSPPLDASIAARERRARSAVTAALAALGTAYERHWDVSLGIEALAPAIRRWIEDETFVVEQGGAGLQLVDAQGARYGTFDALHIVGLVEGEWPERTRRNIFYGQSLLSSLGWPSEHEGRGAAEAAFVDLLAAATRRVSVSVFTLDDEALVEPASLLSELPRAQLSQVARADGRDARVFVDEALSLEPWRIDVVEGAAREAAELRAGRSDATSPAFHGTTAERTPRPWAVSALETYLQCPFKFFARHILKLEEEPEDEEVMDPKRQGQFVHTVFENFFVAWRGRGEGAITPVNLAEARALFSDVVEDALRTLPESEAALQRTYLLGSPAASGVGEAVLRMEAERPMPVVDRLLEHTLEGTFTFDDGSGPREIALRGKADRIDLLADGTFRLIDYKTGRAPAARLALQLPIYSLCAEQQLARERGGQWTLGEAAYVAFRGARRIVPLANNEKHREQALQSAQERLIRVIDGIEAGTFPPMPTEVFKCDSCTYAAVCRKDFVGDV